MDQLSGSSTRCHVPRTSCTL